MTTDYSNQARGFINRYNWLRTTLLSGVNLNCTTKTAQRYINRLRADGYTITYDIPLNGYVISGQNQETVKVLKQAYRWAIKNGHTAPWVAKAEKILK